MSKVVDVAQIKTGDVFHWRYKDKSDYLAYWAKSCIAVALEGKYLRDTYWSGNDGGVFWTFAEAVAKLDLTYIGNFSELEKIRDDDAKYYSESDVVSLNHPNSSQGNVYRRIGTQRNQAAMLAALDRAVEKAESDKRSAERDLERLRETRAQIERGDLDKVWL